MVPFVKLFILYLISIIPIVLIAYITCKLFGIIHKQIELDFLMKFLLVVLLAPIYEEIFFRSLLKFNRLTISLFIAILVGFVLWTIFKESLFTLFIHLPFYWRQL